VLDGGERRRPSWQAFRRAYPTFLKIASVLLLLLVAFDLWLWYRQRQYQGEIDRLRGAMTESERDKSDLLIEAEQSKVKMALALARHQARWDPQLHLAVAVDSGRMYLMRDGAMLRDMRVSITPEPIPWFRAIPPSVQHVRRAPHVGRALHLRRVPTCRPQCVRVASAPFRRSRPIAWGDRLRSCWWAGRAFTGARIAPPHSRATFASRPPTSKRFSPA
jgi:hypothetical protein